MGFIAPFAGRGLLRLGAGLTPQKRGAQKWTAVKTAPLHKVGNRVRAVPYYWQGV